MTQGTYISKADIAAVIHLSAEEIRAFLATASSSGLNEEACGVMEAFRRNPHAYSDQELVNKGRHVAQAIDEPARIEVRNMSGDVAAQVVAKGIWGPARLEAVERIRQKLKEAQCHIQVRLAGSSSFEFNATGIDKSVPIRFMRANWASVLKQMGYTPGPSIDSSKTATIIAADGDSTLYDGPKPGQPLPTVGMSLVQEPLVKYLQAGGIFLLISGNDLNRTIARVKDGVPGDLAHRFLVSANGGADLVCLNSLFQPQIIDGYIHQIVEGMIEKPLDIVYIGDDGSPNGNDWPAFQEVGLPRSVLVAKAFEIDYDSALRSSYVGGLLQGTANFLKTAVAFSQDNPYQTLFNQHFLIRTKFKAL